MDLNAQWATESGITYTVSRIEIGHYTNPPNPRIQLFDEDGAPLATASANVPVKLDEGEVAIKNWSENEGILNFLIDHGLVEAPHRRIETGFVWADICKLKAE